MFLSAVIAPFLVKYLAKIGIYLVPKDVVDFFCKIVDETIGAREKEEVVSFPQIQLMYFPAFVRQINIFLTSKLCIFTCESAGWRGNVVLAV